MMALKTENHFPSIFACDKFPMTEFSLFCDYWNVLKKLTQVSDDFNFMRNVIENL